MNHTTTLRIVPVVFALGLFGTACAASDGETSTEPEAPADTTTTTGDGTDSSTDGSTDSTDEAPLGAGPYPIATLEIEVTHPDIEPISYSISCLGDTATVTGEVDIDEQAACGALAAEEAKTRLLEGVPADQVCTEIYGGPDEAHITGTYDDEPVDATIDRANGCGIHDWDEVFGDVLPTALGITEE